MNKIKVLSASAVVLCLAFTSFAGTLVTTNIPNAAASRKIKQVVNANLANISNKFATAVVAFSGSNSTVQAGSFKLLAAAGSTGTNGVVFSTTFQRAPVVILTTSSHTLGTHTNELRTTLVASNKFVVVGDNTNGVSWVAIDIP